MNTHDIDIELPPLPESDGEIEVAMAGRLVPIVVYRPSTVHDYARAAVLADRERRAQPAPPDDALRQDAERYRWLRDANINTLPYDDHGIGPEFPCGDDLDAAVDSAMRKGGKQ